MTGVEKITVGIRADGNGTIGMGHLMRCMSIAYGLQEQGMECAFYTAGREAGKVLTEKGFFCRVLDTDYRDMESELPLLKQLLKESGCRLLLVDSYQMTQKYLDQLMEQCPVFYMDDMGTAGLTADGIINHNIYGQELGYEAWCPAGTMLLLGAGYAPVKKAFTETAYHVRDRVSRIMITMGGSDTLNIAGQLGERLLRMLPEETELDIICGRFNPHLDTLKEMAGLENRLHILVDVQDMWNKMAAVDIAVSAAGSTMYELSAMGVPTVCCYYVENQRRIAEGFGEKVQMVNAGDFSAEEEAVLDRLCQEVCRLAKDTDARKALSGRMKQVADGRGAERIARELQQKILQN